MSSGSILTQLRETFVKQNKELWKQAASQEIKESEPVEKLSWSNPDGIKFFPYYESTDVASLEYLKKFQQKPDESSFSGARKWICVPAVSVTDEKADNRISLDHLSHGADGIYFRATRDISLEVLLENIAWPHCSLFFQCSNVDSLQKKIISLIDKKKFDRNSLTGALFWEVLPRKSDVQTEILRLKKFMPLGIIIHSSSPAREVADALIRGVQVVEEFGLTEIGEAFSGIAFSLPASPDFFECIAKLKSLRNLWYQIARAYAIPRYSLSDLHIHARSSPWISSDFGPHSNMLKGTTAAMASIIGGCDALTVMPESEQHSTMNRIARNVSSILREESHLNNVADPLAGSYAVDTMVHEISKTAWSLFQSGISA